MDNLRQNRKGCQSNFNEIIMNKKAISGGTAHKMTPDLRQALVSNTVALAIWETLTPLARNEWICWVTFVKKEETRKDHVKRVISELKQGMRRPCCWIGCIHRKDKAISPSIQGILNRRSKKNKKTMGTWPIVFIYAIPLTYNISWFFFSGTIEY